MTKVKNTLHIILKNWN